MVIKTANPRLFIFQLLVSFTCICFIAYLLDPYSLIRSFLEINITSLGLCLIVAILGIFIQAQKWRILLSYCQPKTKMKDVLCSLFLGIALGLFTPGRLGEIGRGFYFNTNRIITSLFAATDRAISLLCTLLMAVFAIKYLDLFSEYYYQIFFVGVGLVCVLLLLLKYSTTIRHKRIKFIFQQFRVVSSMDWFWLFIWSLLFNIVFCSQFFIIIGWQYQWDINAASLIPIVYALKAIVPLGVGDLGVREGVAVYVYSTYGFDPKPAFTASLCLFVINVLIPGIIGWICSAHRVLVK